MRAGMALATGGACGATVPAVAWAVGGAGGPVWAAVGAALGVLGGSAHLVTLRRALAGQEDDLVAHVRDVAGRLLTVSDVVPEPGRAAVSVPSPRAADDASPGPGPGPGLGSRSAGSVGAGSVGAASLRTSARAVAGHPVGDLLERTVVDLVATARRSTGLPSGGDPAAVHVVLGRNGLVRTCSGRTAAVLGWRDEELHGQPLAGLVHSGDLAAFAAVVDAALAGPRVGPERARVRVRTARNEWRVLDWSARTAADASGILLSARDVTDHARIEDDLRYQASHDPLTGLPNRTTMMRLAAEAVVGAGPEWPLSVLMIDLDRFKDVNDSLGHVIGDQLLAQVGPRLRAALRPLDVIARIGGDEFAVLLPAAGEDGARRVAERLAEALDTPFVVNGMDLHVEASVGIAVSHRPGRPDTCTVEGLLREADIAMYRAKGEGLGIVRFEPEYDSGDGRSRLELSAELRRAIAEEQLVLHYQPVVDVVEGRLAGVEALVRWQHPERGLLNPGTFLPLAEQTGLIIPLSRLVLVTAVTQAAAWQAEGHPVQIAVNMSPRWLAHADVPAEVSAVLEEQQLPPELLRLEITESVVLAHPQQVLGMLEDLRSMGIGLSLDDFGTGYSSMTHLRNLPVDELKVDRGFVHTMTTSPEDAVIVRAAVELGHNLGMAVVAEGIEDADTLAEVVASGCSLAQGWYFSKALPAADLIPWAVDRFPDFGNGEPAARRPRAT